MEFSSSASFVVRRRGNRCRTVVNALIIAALFAGQHMAMTFTVAPTTVAGEISRRSAAVLATGLLAAAPGAVLAEEATKALDPSQQYTVASVFKVNFPPEWPITQKTRDGFFMQPDKTVSAEIMSAAGKVVRYTSLKDGVGDVKDLSTRSADKMAGGEGKVVSANFVTVGGREAYEMELVNNVVHEKWIVSLVPRGNDFIYCNVVVRTAPDKWDQRKATFDKILASFTPIEQTA
eukprot:CAMPEP_0172667356 /NCGR_PEP_ID=MMETSP1074-20121228/8370_1 /TAXON_ID=2916 /ORGANISM="Ceratium fusus, Strain PA161109" /LENGTH=233 /DNA_ID=CAMNT_0013483845 /DNA_START=50 /DNA_END=751 /DNA_ORIENTATION=-